MSECMCVLSFKVGVEQGCGGKVNGWSRNPPKAYPPTNKLNQTPSILLGITTVKLQVSQHRPSLTGSALLPSSHPVILQGEIGVSHIEQSIDYTSVVYL